MTTEIRAGTLQKAMKVIKPVLEKRSAFPLANSIMFKPSDDGTAIYATNLEQFVEVIMPARIVDKTVAIADGKTFIAKLDTFSQDEPLRFAVLDSALYLKTSVAKFKFPITDTYDLFDTITDNTDNKMAKLSKYHDDLISYALQVSSAAAKKDEVRLTSLQGVALYPKNNLLYIVASDGHRLHMITTQDTYNITEPTVLSVNAIRILSLCDDIQCTVWSRGYEDPYPDFFSVIPNTFNLSIVYDIKHLKSAISTVLFDSVSPVIFTITPTQTSILTRNPDKGEAEYIIQHEHENEPIGKYSTETFKIAFNSKYLIDALSFIHDGYASFEFTDSDSALKIVQTPKIALIMPMRI